MILPDKWKRSSSQIRATDGWDLSHTRMPSTCWLALTCLCSRRTSKEEPTSSAKQSLYPYQSFRRSYQARLVSWGPTIRDTFAPATPLPSGSSCSARSPTTGFIETSNNGLQGYTPWLARPVSARRGGRCWPSSVEGFALLRRSRLQFLGRSVRFHHPPPSA